MFIGSDNAATDRPVLIGNPPRSVPAAGRAATPDSNRPAPGPGRPGPLGGALCAAGIVLLPWLFVLATKLPATAYVAHWSTVWVGLDSLQAIGLCTTGILLRRRDPRAALGAAVTATLVLVDAWFDVTTAATGGDRVTAVAMALGLELPMSTLLTVVAMRVHPRPGP